MAEPGKQDAPDNDAGDADQVAEVAPTPERTDDRSAQAGPYQERADDRIARLEDQAERMTRALELIAQRAAAPRRDWDAVAALVATFIGAIALAVSGYTAYVQRQQLRAQVWPQLRIDESDGLRHFQIINNGTGPARIIAARVAMGGVAVPSWWRVRKAAGYADERTALSTFHNAVLPPGKEFEILKSADDDASRTKFLELLPGGKHEVSIMVCYCSVLGDCWIADMTSEKLDGRAIEADECPIDPDERFEN